MRLHLIAPRNSTVSILDVSQNRLNRYRVWKPLSLLLLAARTPPEWDVTVLDENLGLPDYENLPVPDLAAITAFTSQATRAYEIAAIYRKKGVPVVMGGIHASMRPDEALEHVDVVVKGEGEGPWPEVLEDCKRGELKKVYEGAFAELDEIPGARHELLSEGYRIGSIQTTRGCPFKCDFCSVTFFNGSRRRHRPVEEVVEELRRIKEKHIIFVDDNLVIAGRGNLERAKELFRAMIKADLKKVWGAQMTLNIADDDELLELAAKAGCFAIFIGIETPSEEGLKELKKNINLPKLGEIKAAVDKIHKHGILVNGSFIMGLDVHKKGIGRLIAEESKIFGIDIITVMFMTPLPGTGMWDRLEAEGRILTKTYPEDWKYYTLNFPVMRYNHLSWTDMVDEIKSCYKHFYGYPAILGRALRHLSRLKKPLNAILQLVINLSYKHNLRLDLEAYRTYFESREEFKASAPVCADTDAKKETMTGARA